MRTRMLLLISVLACARERPAPPVPSELRASVEATQQAVERQAGGEVAEACEKLSAQLSEHRSRVGSPRLQADLQQLAMAVAAFGAASDPMQPVPAAQWHDLRQRIERVLSGQSPESPRMQIDMPQDVRAAIAAADQALASGDVEASLRAIGGASAPIMQWASKMPGPRAHRLMQVAEGDLMRITMYPKQDLTQIQSAWSQAKRRLEPNAD